MQTRSTFVSSTSPTQRMQGTPRFGGAFAVMSPRSNTRNNAKLLQNGREEQQKDTQMVWLRLVYALP